MDHRLLAFAAAAAVVIVIPGPSVVFTVGRALAAGRSAALATVVGNAVGVFLQVVAVAVGLGHLVAQSAAAFTVLKLVGAAYLVYLGIAAFRHRHDVVRAMQRSAGDARRVGPARRVVDGLVVGVLNPKSVVFFVAFLPQFVDARGPVVTQILLLGAFFVAIGLVLDSVWALAAGSARAWFASSPRRIAAVGGAGGLAMIGLGVGVAVTGSSQ
ncbi:LysE family translocator [Pseudonocardia sp. ICBG162]|uniref:LysE family translocator n=1 Tax=Pseudonocardia sp. ICBG162 TaxID=2846761 RepID=UPI001CF68B6D|nr:LysE family translocator [Pseudonocardia sp. ICBG162]